MVSQVTAFIARRWCLPRGAVRVEVQPLPGGLESSVARVRLSRPRLHKSIPPQFVMKRVPVRFGREAEVYEVLWQHLARPPAVRMIGRDTCAEAVYLYLEDVQSSIDWPWSDTQRAGSVCRVLASLHDDRALPRASFVWDYEAELARSALQTVELARDARDATGERYWRRVGELRRVAEALPRIRARLLSGLTSVIHGDMHPGNVILREGADPEVVLIDWARARIGSPLEDVASWLHSLGCWEPEARRRHDTLMRLYLDARRTRRIFGGDLRVDYWLASASNGLSGAIRYHLAVLSDSNTPERARYDSGQALMAWARVIRRAAALLPALGR